MKLLAQRYACDICDERFDDGTKCQEHEAAHRRDEAKHSELSVGSTIRAVQHLGDGYTRNLIGRVVQSRGTVGRKRNWRCLLEFPAGERAWAEYVGWPSGWSESDIADSLDSGWDVGPWLIRDIGG